MGGYFPGRRKPVPGVCGKNILPRNLRFLGAIRPRRRGWDLFFTPRKIPSRSRLLGTEKFSFTNNAR